MTIQSYAGAEVNINGEGYLTNADDWTPAIAEAIASEVGIDLGDSHWEVIRYARDDFGATGKSPGLRRIAANTSTNIKALYQLFPKGPGKLVARIAGTPKPKSCL